MDTLIAAMLWLLNPLGINEPTFQFMLISAMLGISVYLTLYAGMLSLANAGFMAIGAYTSVLLTQSVGVSVWVAILLGMTLAALMAIPIGLPVLRLRDIYLAIATIGFSEVVRILLLNMDKIMEGVAEVFTDERVTIRFFNGARGLAGIPQLIDTGALLLIVVGLAIFVIRLNRTRLGMQMSAIRQDEQAAQALGIDVVRVKTTVFVLSASVAALAGACEAHFVRFIAPGDYDFALTVDILAYAVLGGTGTWLGPIFGGMVLTALPETLRFLDQLRNVINGVVLLGVVIYLPDGLLGSLPSDPLRKLQRRLAALTSRPGTR